MNFNNLSSHTKSLYQEIIDPIKSQYLEYQIKKIEKIWVSRYKSIKDDGWPECNCFQDFHYLNPNIKDECVNQHNFSPEIFIDSVCADADQKFSPLESIKFNSNITNFLKNHNDIIKNQKIVDFACNIGKWGFFAVQNQASSVVGVDIRDNNLLLANSIKQDFNLPDCQIRFECSDIHNYKENKRLCADKDTVFLLGILYHIHDHYNILESICQSNIKSVVITTGIYNSDEPVVWWKTEPTFELIAGWQDNQQHILVGYPSIAYLDLLMSNLGFKKIDQDFYDMNVSSQQTYEFDLPRAILLYKNTNIK